ncbi:MAG: hypothetical protein PHE12_01655 [Clostridia bacterium]|nr:hypothetical protein [Clostridia bacterium]
MSIKMREVIELSCVLLQLEYALLLLKEPESLDEKLIEQAQKDVEQVLCCANYICEEIAADYINLKAVQHFESETGQISYSAFEHIPIDIYAVKQGGKNIPFKLYPQQLMTLAGELEVLYTYKPQKKEIDDFLDFDARLSARAAAYGTAAEYSLMKGLYEESVIWDKRYKDSLFSALKTKKSINMPKRRWV